MSVVDLEKISPILRANDITFAGLFGSRVKGTARSDSDLDFLIKFKKPMGLLTLIGLENQLSDVLGVRVDLVTEDALSPYLRNTILNELQIIYGQRWALHQAYPRRD